ncbi:peptidoglycan-binding protein [Streptomyces sp. NPDC057910]|uniref:peptidoglycan-binding domain-containing protein n=1 Tax=Streptomyces sp. NPDC057910 TaxID=3346278 RepID=UPI0036EB97C3
MALSPEKTTAPRASSAPARTPGTSPVGPRTTLRPGDRGDEVLRLQRLLFGQGFTFVAETAVYDGPTRQGVEKLQRERGLKDDPSGICGPSTGKALGLL